METKKVNCASCDIKCSVLADVEDNKILRIRRDPNHPITPQSLCNKGAAFPDQIYHKDRILYPLKSVGKRGEGKWARVSWDEAMDEIADRLKTIVNRYGAESLAATAGAIVPYDLTRRFLNLIGSPNYISGTYLCLGNTSGVNRITCGWQPFPDYWHTKVIVMWGHDPQPNKWTAEYLWARDAMKRGAKMIVVDPRISFSAKRADLHLRLRPGSDPALLMGWLHVIINEELYDKEFVRNWTVGFDQLKDRVQEYTPQRVEEITWVPADQVVAAARMYASGPAIIPWNPATDQISNSTQALRAMGILRAICGNLDAEGGEMLMGYHPTVMTEDEIALTHMLPPEQKAKQLLLDSAKVLSYEFWEEFNEASEKVWGRKWASQVLAGALANPAAVVKAMKTGKPYPVKAFLNSGSDPVTSFTGAQNMHDGFMSLDLLVSHDIFMVPTCQMSDFVLPAAVWGEKYDLHNHWDWHTFMIGGDKAVDPLGEAKDEYCFWRELGTRMGQEQYWQPKTQREWFEWRLQKVAKNFDEFMAAGGIAGFPEHPIIGSNPQWKKYEKTGFATPSGKVELYSSVMEKYGYDPLPGHVEQQGTVISDPEMAKEYPLTFFIGAKGDPYFQQQGRNIASLRRLAPEPWVEIHPDMAYDLGLSDGDFVAVETPHGKLMAVAKFSDDAHPKVVRVPYRWWLPEQAPYAPNFSGLFQVSDNNITSDAPEYADPYQGICSLRGLMCKVYRVERSKEYSESLSALGESWGGFSDTWGGTARKANIKARLEAQERSPEPAEPAE
jgi:anaerobic selenocysteine-containing dehydrogenase